MSELSESRCVTCGLVDPMQLPANGLLWELRPGLGLVCPVCRMREQDR